MIVLDGATTLNVIPSLFSAQAQINHLLKECLLVHMPARQNEAVIISLNLCLFSTVDHSSTLHRLFIAQAVLAVVCTIFLGVLIAIMVNPMGTMELYQQNTG